MLNIATTTDTNTHTTKRTIAPNKIKFRVSFFIIYTLTLTFLPSKPDGFIRSIIIRIENEIASAY